MNLIAIGRVVDATCDGIASSNPECGSSIIVYLKRCSVGLKRRHVGRVDRFDRLFSATVHCYRLGWVADSNGRGLRNGDAGVQAEAEAAGVFQLLLDNNNAGRGGHRKETGCYGGSSTDLSTAFP